MFVKIQIVSDTREGKIMQLGELKRKYEQSTNKIERLELLRKMEEEHSRLKLLLKDYTPFEHWLRIEKAIVRD